MHCAVRARRTLYRREGRTAHHLKRTLCIVVDTYRVGLVESKDILEKCSKVIDHRRKGVGYIGNPALVLSRILSSASELVTELAVRGRSATTAQPCGGRGPFVRHHAGYPRFHPAPTAAAAALPAMARKVRRSARLFDVTMVELQCQGRSGGKSTRKNCASSVGEVARKPDHCTGGKRSADHSGVDAGFVAVQVGTGVNIGPQPGCRERAR